MEDAVVVGIDIGTTKVCTLVGRFEDTNRIRILGLGIEPSKGIRKGVVVDLAGASQAIARSIDKAEHTSGLEINAALVSLAGSNVSSMNNEGVVGVVGRVIDEMDVMRAMDAARAVAVPHNREVIHVIQRNFTVDGQEGVRTPVGMHGYRLEVEAHIITAASSTIENLRQCVANAGVQDIQFVLNPLAAAEVVLSEAEREMGAIVCDVGGGTTDLAIYIEGDVWHTAVLSIGGGHITSDIAHGLRLPTDQAENIKKRHGHAMRADIAQDEFFTVRPFGQNEAVQVSRQDLAHIIGARVEEIFSLVMQEIKRSGYDGLLPAGMVLTGGTSLIPGIQKVSEAVVGLPVRVAKPENLFGMTDQLNSPAYSASVGLLHWGVLMSEIALYSDQGRSFRGGALNWQQVKEFVKRFLP